MTTTPRSLSEAGLHTAMRFLDFGVQLVPWLAAITTTLSETLTESQPMRVRLQLSPFQFTLQIPGQVPYVPPQSRMSEQRYTQTHAAWTAGRRGTLGLPQ